MRQKFLFRVGRFDWNGLEGETESGPCKKRSNFMEIESRFKNAIAEAEIGLKKLEMQMRNVDEASRKGLQEVRQRLNDTRDAARKKVEEIKSKGGGNWEKARSDVTDFLENLERTLRDIYSHYRLTETDEN
jgi:hypothetical protein